MLNNYTISSNGTWIISSVEETTPSTLTFTTSDASQASAFDTSYKGYYTIPLKTPKKIDYEAELKKCCKKVFGAFELTQEDIKIISQDCEKVKKEMPEINYKTMVMTVAQNYLEFKLNSEIFEENNLLDEVKAFLKEGK